MYVDAGTGARDRIQCNMLQTAEPGALSNAEIADRVSSLAQMLAVEKANPYKVRAYRCCSNLIRTSKDRVACNEGTMVLFHEFCLMH